jgi:hypothetical protein
MTFDHDQGRLRAAGARKERTLLRHSQCCPIRLPFTMTFRPLHPRLVRRWPLSLGLARDTRSYRFAWQLALVHDMNALRVSLRPSCAPRCTAREMQTARYIPTLDSDGPTTHPERSKSAQAHAHVPAIVAIPASECLNMPSLANADPISHSIGGLTRIHQVSNHATVADAYNPAMLDGVLRRGTPARRLA